MRTRNRCVNIMCVIGLLVAGSGLDAGAGDFDGNGLADLAIGAPGENVSDIVDAGAVGVLYGSATGLDEDGNQYWTQSLGLTGSDSESQDHFGTALATGDFDGDGIYDLVVGVPLETVGSVLFAGAINVIYGAKPDGLVTTGNQYWNQNEPGAASSAEAHDQFGSALAAGDFNGDGYDDLAVGVPGEDIDLIVDAGAVHVMHGSASGLQTSDDYLWSGDLAGSSTEEGDRFGDSVASGDFDNDGYDDLAIGAPYEDLVDITDSGAVNILYGSPGGLIARPSNDFWHQDRSGIPETAEEWDYFGEVLAVGDFDSDGHDDLAIGVPLENVGSPEIINAGCVHVMYGSPTGLDATGNDFFHQDSADIGSLAEEGDGFGESLAAGDFNGDGHDDLAIGSPSEDWNQDNTGIVQVVWGSSSGLFGPDELWREDLLDEFGGDEEGDKFGWALAAGDFDGDGDDDLAVSSPFEDIQTADDCGIVFVLPGTPSGLSSANQWWHQGKYTVLGTFETGDRFGSSLVAIPDSKVLFADGFETGDTSTWSTTSP